MSIYIDEFEKIYNTSDSLTELRHKIYELALTGNLYNDETKKFSLRQNADIFIEDEEVDTVFDALMPINWKKVKLGNLIEIISGTSYGKGNISSEGIRILRGGNIQEGKILYLENDVFLPIDFKNRSSLIKGDIVIVASTGSKTVIGKPGFAEASDTKCQIGAFLRVLRPVNEKIAKFLYLYFSSGVYRNYISNVVQGTNINNIKNEHLNEQVIFIPPYEVIDSITERVNSLLAQIDQLEAKLKKKEHLLELLPQAVVDAIASSETEHQLKEQLEFVIENFELIFQTPESMQDLRNVILQLAIEGKLVPQDPTDEPASELLKKIKAEREQLVREKKIKKPAVLEPISEDEVPFEIPESWEWVKLGELCYKITDGSHNPPAGVEGIGYPMLSAININNGIDFSKPSRIISNEAFEIENKRTEIKTNDVLLTIVGTIGRAVVVETDVKFALQRSVAVLKTGINSYFLRDSLMSPFAFSQMTEESKGTAQKGIYLGKLNNLLMPIPPIIEQVRIVEKVNTLMAIIDQLEQKLKKKVEIIEMLGTA